jgi:hypothetical protein
MGEHEMTDEDFEAIEAYLGSALAAHYREKMRTYPLDARNSAFTLALLPKGSRTARSAGTDAPCLENHRDRVRADHCAAYPGHDAAGLVQDAQRMI